MTKCHTILNAVLKVLCVMPFVPPQSTAVRFGGSESTLQSLTDVLQAFGGKDTAVESLKRGAEWLQFSQLESDELPANTRDTNYEMYNGSWRGAFRGEYQAGTDTFSFFGCVCGVAATVAMSLGVQCMFELLVNVLCCVH